MSGGAALSDIYTGEYDPNDVYIAELLAAFKFYDVDHSGTISTKELGSLVRSLGQNPTESELHSLINEADADNNGVIDFPEFVILMTQKLKTTDAEETIREAWRVFDMDGNGVLELWELRHVMLNMGEGVTEDEVNEILKDADRDGDGHIQFEEFRAMLKCATKEQEEGEEAVVDETQEGEEEEEQT